MRTIGQVSQELVVRAVRFRIGNKGHKSNAYQAKLFVIHEWLKTQVVYKKIVYKK